MELKIPERIWLQYHGDANPADYPADDYPDADEVSWCWEPIFEHDIEYVLLDKYKELEAERDRWEAAFNSERASCVSVQAERDKLREALLLISSSKRESPSYCLDPKVGLAKARGIARKALEETP